jgi:hypothetical protein
MEKEYIDITPHSVTITTMATITRLDDACGADHECYRIAEDDRYSFGYVFSFHVQYVEAGSMMHANVRSKLERMVSPCLNDSDALEYALLEEQALYCILVEQISTQSPLYSRIHRDQIVRWEFCNHISR